MKKTGITILILTLMFPLFAGYRMDWKTETLNFAGAAGVWALSYATDSPLEMEGDFSGGKEYVKSLDRVSDVGVGLSLALPLGFAFDSERITLGMMYAETLAWTFSVRSFTKALCYRNRPYADYGQQVSDDDQDSFISGHTAFAFASAAFIDSVTRELYPDSQWRKAASISSYVLASTVGALRIGSGCHYPTDVLAGAAVGLLSGYLIPLMHKSIDAPVQVALMPGGVCATISV